MADVRSYIRLIEGFEISYSLGHRGTMRCRTVDAKQDIATAYRPKINDAIVITIPGGHVVFKGRIVSTTEVSMEAGTGFGTQVDVDAVDHSEIFDYTYIDRAWGSDPIPILTVVAGSPGWIMTLEEHGFANGDSVQFNDVQSVVPSLNGNVYTVVVINPNTFYLQGVDIAASGGAGTVRKTVYAREIFESLIAALPAGAGIQRDPSMPQGPLMEKVVVNGTIRAGINEVAKRIGWVQRLLPNGLFEAYPPGSRAPDFELNGNNIIGGAPEISQTIVHSANTIRVVYGSNAILERKELFIGNGVQQVFPLRYRPTTQPSDVSPGQVILLSEDSAVRHVGIWGHEPLFEWVYRWSDNSLVQLPEWVGGVTTPLAPGAQIAFNLMVQFPQYVEVSAPGVTPDTRRTKMVQAANVFDWAAAQEVGQQELARSSKTPRQITADTYAALSYPGSTIRNNLPARLLTGNNWLVVSVRITEDDIVEPPFDLNAKFRYSYELAEDNEQQPGWIDFLGDLKGGSSTGSVAISGVISTPPPGSGGGGGTTGGVSGTGIAGSMALWTGTTSIGASSLLREQDGIVVSSGGLRLLAGYLSSLGSLIVAPSDGLILPLGGVHIGKDDQKFLSLHAADLRVETLVAQDMIATIGGYILVGPTTKLVADLAANATTIVVEHNNLVPNAVVLMKKIGQVEAMRVLSGATAFGGNWAYTVQRNLDASGANDWHIGDAVFNTGTPGHGWIELYSQQSMRGANDAGPTIVGNVRVGSGHNQWEPRWAIGRLDILYHNYGAGSNVFGAAFGHPPWSAQPNAWLTIDSVSGLMMGRGGTIAVHIDPAGNASFTGVVTVTGGNAAKTDMSNVTIIDGGKITTNSILADRLNVNALSSITANLGTVVIGVNGFLASEGVSWGGGTGVFLGWTGSNYGFRAGSLSGQHVLWDGGNLEVWAGNIIINSGGLQIPFGDWFGGSRILIGNTAIFSEASGVIKVEGGLGVQGNFGVALAASVNGDFNAFGFLKTHQPVEFHHSVFSWAGAQSTTSADRPLVWSPNNANVYQKTNGANGTINLTGGGYIVVENGIVVNGG